MLTLCSEICHSKAAAQATVERNASKSKPEAASKLVTNGAHQEQRLRQPGASFGVADGAKLGGEEAFVVMQPSPASVLQNALENEVKARSEDLDRVQRQEERRSELVVALEREVFEKERILSELSVGIEKLGISSEGLETAFDIESLTTKEMERLSQEIQLRDGEASDLRQRVSALEELIREKRAEVSAKGEATLLLLFQLSCAAPQNRISADIPATDAVPAVATDGDATPAL